VAEAEKRHVLLTTFEMGLRKQENKGFLREALEKTKKSLSPPQHPVQTRKWRRKMKENGGNKYFGSPQKNPFSSQSLFGPS